MLSLCPPIPFSSHLTAIHPHNSFATTVQEIPDLLEALDENDMMFWWRPSSSSSTMWAETRETNKQNNDNVWVDNGSVISSGRTVGRNEDERFNQQNIDCRTAPRSRKNNVTTIHLHIFFFTSPPEGILYYYRYTWNGLLVFIVLFRFVDERYNDMSLGMDILETPNTWMCLRTLINTYTTNTYTNEKRVSSRVYQIRPTLYLFFVSSYCEHVENVRLYDRDLDVRR